MENRYDNYDHNDLQKGQVIEHFRTISKSKNDKSMTTNGIGIE